jgi:hypothetical protein
MTPMEEAPADIVQLTEDGGCHMIETVLMRCRD